MYLGTGLLIHGMYELVVEEYLLELRSRYLVLPVLYLEVPQSLKQ